ncbi:RE114 protein, partial [Todus mexicanus]|nr:RE114 protein [Todus mexicanus]
MAVPGGGGRLEPGRASAPGPAGNTSRDTSLLGSATTWPLKRYGRFLPPRDDGDEGQNASSWKVFESNEESGPLILTIVVSGHFFISQGRTVLEGFSLIDSHKWLKIVRRVDCLLLQAQSKVHDSLNAVSVQSFCANKKEPHREDTCWGSLREILFQEAHKCLLLKPYLSDAEFECSCSFHKGKKCLIYNEPLPDSYASLGERRSVTQLAQSVLRKRSELPLAYRHAAWQAQELGPFIRLCLMDQNFPAFVEDVEKELKKLTEG